MLELMAINFNPSANSRDSSPISSPRLSFSNDLPSEPNPNPQVENLTQSNSKFEFNFCVPPSRSDDFDHNTCSADQLFFNGMIVPTQLRDKIKNHASESGPLDQEVQDEEITTTKASLIREEKGGSQSKSFWRFKRSSSLNCENYSKKGSIWSFPQLLSRSNSTGSGLISSISNPKHKVSYLQKSGVRSPSISTSTSNTLKRPPIVKANGNGNGNGSRTSYVLNVPPPYIAKGTSDLLGLGSFFKNGKDRKNKK